MYVHKAAEAHRVYKAAVDGPEGGAADEAEAAELFEGRPLTALGRMTKSQAYEFS